MSEESASDEGKGSPRHSKDASMGSQGDEGADIEMGPVSAAEPNKGSLPSDGDAPLHKAQTGAGLPWWYIVFLTPVNFALWFGTKVFTCSNV